VYENDDATTDSFYFPDEETVRFEYESDGVSLSAAGTAETSLESDTGDEICLGDVDASEHDGDELDTTSVDGGTVTFEDLPAGEYEVDVAEADDGDGSSGGGNDGDL
jgi:hypothetical protein